MTFAVLGCGSIGRRHIRNLLALGQERIVAYDPDEQRLAAARALGAEIAGDARQALAAEPVAVFVCTPPADHADGIRLALEAGAHVFVEKPLADRLDGLADLLAEVESAGRRIEVGYSLRWHRGLREAKEHADAGRIGEILHMRAEFGQFLPDWRPGQDYRDGYNASVRRGGGVVLDQSHEIDYVRWFAGEPEAVTAITGRVSSLEIDAEDLAVVVLRMANARFAEIHVDSVRRDYQRACTILGSEGTLVWSLTEGIRIFDAARREWDVRRTVPDANEMYVEEVRHFLDVVRGSVAPLVTGRDALRTLEIALAARRSAAERREVILSGTIAPSADPARSEAR